MFRKIAPHRLLPVPFQNFQRHTQHFLCLAAVDRQELIGLEQVDPALKIVVKRVEPLLVDTALDPLHHKGGKAQRLLAGLATHFGVVADRLGDNVAGASQRIFDRRHRLVQKSPRHLRWKSPLAQLGQDPLRQRLQPTFTGQAGPCAPFGTVRLVEIFQRSQRLRRQQLRLQLGCQFPLLPDRSQDGRTPFVQAAQRSQPLLDRTNLFFVQPARPFFAVTGDERERIPLVQQLHGGCHMPLSQPQTGGNSRRIRSRHRCGSFRHKKRFPL